MPKNKLTKFEYRLQLLAKQGYHSYKEYLKSPKWRDTKARFLKSKLFKSECFVCGIKNVAFDIHHMTYKRLGNEWLNDLVALCRDCHNESHDLIKEKRSNLRGAAKKLKRLKEKEIKLLRQNGFKRKDLRKLGYHNAN